MTFSDKITGKLNLADDLDQPALPSVRAPSVRGFKFSFTRPAVCPGSFLDDPSLELQDLIEEFLIGRESFDPFDQPSHIPPDL
jgi:hypothetical protein